MSNPTCTVCRGTMRYPIYNNDGVQVAEADCPFCCHGLEPETREAEAA